VFGLLLAVRLLLSSLFLLKLFVRVKENTFSIALANLVLNLAIEARADDGTDMIERAKGSQRGGLFFEQISQQTMDDPGMHIGFLKAKDSEAHQMDQRHNHSSLFMVRQLNNRQVVLNHLNYGQFWET
jgi:hypothetical protein